MRKYLENILSELIDYPDQMKINETKSESICILEIHLNASDRGKVIGKEGKNIYSIRNLMQSVASRKKIRVEIVIIE